MAENTIIMCSAQEMAALDNWSLNAGESTVSWPHVGTNSENKCVDTVAYSRSKDPSQQLGG